MSSPNYETHKLWGILSWWILTQYLFESKNKEFSRDSRWNKNYFCNILSSVNGSTTKSPMTKSPVTKAPMTKSRVDPTYFFEESILTEALHDTPTFEVPLKPSCYTFLALQIIIDTIFLGYGK